MRASDSAGGRLELDLLGPLRVTVGGRPVEVTAGRLRALLALLAMSAGESVSVHQLATALWDEQLPGDARKAIQVYVARLRAELDAEVIETSRAGYALRADPDQVDALRFVRLLDAARSAAGGAEERGLLDEALALWRGTPFEDVRSPWLDNSQAPLLVEHYLAGLERRIDLDLAAGRAGELVPELAELTSRYPYRESLWLRRLMVLERAGRRAEALAQYETVRAKLADELGTDPGPELRGVHAELLTDRAPAWSTVPRQLPADVEGFTGRAGASSWLDESLEAGALVICAIAGPGGIGKSALAIHAAHRHASRYPDGQLYVDLQGSTSGLRPLPPIEVLGRFLRALGADAAAVPADLDEAGAAFRSRVADRRVLIVLDNAAEAAQVRPLLPAGPGCAVLITSRVVLSGLDGARQLRLDVLAAQEATQLLGRLAGPERIAAEPEAAAAVIESCGSLPLAVRIAAARLAARPAWPVRELAERLADAQRRLDELELAETGARASFAVSTEQARDSTDPLDRKAVAAFGLLGVLDGPELGVPAVARLLDEPEQAAERILERLVDIQLLETPSPGRYRLHDLLRLYARELAGQRPERDALTRVLEFYVATAWRTLELLRPGDYRLTRTDARRRTGGLELADDQAALAWLDTERPNLIAAVHQASGVAAELGVQLAHNLYGFFMVREHWSDWEQVGRTALAVARERDDRLGQAQVHNDLGVRFWRLGEYEQALASLRESLALRRELGDRPGQAATLVNLGLVHQWQGRYDESLACAQESLAISRSIGDRRAEAGGLSNLGDVYQRVGRYEEATTCLQDSLRISTELGDRKGRATSLNNLGALYERQGRHEQALAFQRDSLAIFRELGDRDGEAFCLTDIGIVHQRQGQLDRALACLRESLAIREQLGDLHGQTETRRELDATLRHLDTPPGGQHAPGVRPRPDPRPA